MFNKKYKQRIEELEEIISKKENVMKAQAFEIQRLKTESASLGRNNISLSYNLETKDREIERLNTKIK